MDCGQRLLSYQNILDSFYTSVRDRAFSDRRVVVVMSPMMDACAFIEIPALACNGRVHPSAVLLRVTLRDSGCHNS